MAKRLEHPAHLKVHNDAFEYAKQLIKQGKVNCSEDVWSADQPTPASEDAFLSDHDFKEYGKWFLATKEDTARDTKEHFEFPVGNFNEVYRAGVIAAKQRAAQFNHHDIEAAANELLELMDENICKA
jgi:hypothetical protein